MFDYSCYISFLQTNAPDHVDSKDQKDSSLLSPFSSGKLSVSPQKEGPPKASEDPNSKPSPLASVNGIIDEKVVKASGNYKVPYAPYELDYDLFPVSDKADVFYDYPARDVYEANKQNYGFESAYPKNSQGYMADEGYKVYSNDQGGYLGPQPYAMPYAAAQNGYVSDQGYATDENEESNDVLYQDRNGDEKVPTISPMSNKEYMRKLGFHIPGNKNWTPHSK